MVKANLMTRMIVDDVNEKVYLSVEGKVDEATQAEKETLRNKLVDAFSLVLGLPAPSQEVVANVMRDFEPTEAEVPAEILPEEDEQEPADEGAETPAEESLVAETKTSVKEDDCLPFDLEEGEKKEFVVSKDAPPMKFGTYAGKNAYEALAQDGEKAISYLKEKMRPLLVKNVKRYPKNQEIIDSIDQAIALFLECQGTELTGPEMIELIKKLSLRRKDKEFNAVNQICLALGTTFEELPNENEELIREVFKEFEQILD